eukprot:10985674-Ditylum_brightwellii.AAC.1
MGYVANAIQHEGGRQDCEAGRDYSIKSTILSPKIGLGKDLLCGMCNDGKHKHNEEESSDDSSYSSIESCFDESEEGEKDNIAFKFVGLPEFQTKEVLESLK